MMTWDEYLRGVRAAFMAEGEKAKTAKELDELLRLLKNWHREMHRLLWNGPKPPT